MSEPMPGRAPADPGPWRSPDAWLSRRPVRRERSLSTTVLIAVTVVALGGVAGCAMPMPDPTPPMTAPSAWHNAPVAAPARGSASGSTAAEGRATAGTAAEGAAADGSPAVGKPRAAADRDWWRAVGDPVLLDLIAAAQADNPGLGVTVARIDQARAAARVAGAALVPRIETRVSSARSKTPMPPVPVVMTMATGSLDSVWELDLFGSLRHGRQAAAARADGALFQWHDARISLAAEVAQAYLDARTCEAQQRIYDADLASLERSRALTAKKLDAGFGAPADLELVTASAADGAGRVRGQQGQCRLDRLTLAWLTGLSIDEVDGRLATAPARLPVPVPVTVGPVPAEVLADRPDLAALAQEIAAASFDVGVARADRFPKLSLTGSIGYSRASAFGSTFKGPQWSIGPGLVAPLFDGGRSAALVAQADARFAEAVATWQQRARLAVREVESALIRIQSADDRLADADRAVAAWERYLHAAETRYETGFGSLFEQEEARRSTLTAQSNALRIRAEAFAGWLSLYKAVGGGWEAEPPTATAGIETTAVEAADVNH